MLAAPITQAIGLSPMRLPPTLFAYRHGPVQVYRRLAFLGAITVVMVAAGVSPLHAQLSPPQTAAPQPIPTPAPLPGQLPAAPHLPEVAPKSYPRAHPAPAQETYLSQDPIPTLQPDTFFNTAKTSERYLAIVDAGGWPVVPTELHPGSTGKAVALLRRRLSIEGDLADRSSAENWDPALTAAVKHFQFRMALKQTGVLAGATLRAMNVPAAVRFKQLASSAQRLAGLNFPFGDRYVVVNIPSTTVEAVEGGAVVKRYVAIAGDIEHPSPEVSARITEVNLNPTWTVPQSIIKNEIIPKMRRDPHYLSRSKIRILTPSGTEVDPRAVNWNSDKAVNYVLRQDSGAGNSLGSIRINMPNPHAVYMHDTPSKRLFGADYRFLWHGCVRVEGVYDLAEWLLHSAPSGSWNKSVILSQVATGEPEDVKLGRPVPVAWTYLTGWANSDRIAHFRDDVYGIDTVGNAAQVRADGPFAAPR
jgi:murein L,D-transpeptidase YcbB/YkuD